MLVLGIAGGLRSGLIADSLVQIVEELGSISALLDLTLGSETPQQATTTDIALGVSLLGARTYGTEIVAWNINEVVDISDRHQGLHFSQQILEKTDVLAAICVATPLRLGNPSSSIFDFIRMLTNASFHSQEVLTNKGASSFTAGAGTNGDRILGTFLSCASFSSWVLPSLATALHMQIRWSLGGDASHDFSRSSLK